MRQISVDTLQATTAETLSGNASVTRLSNTAKALEIWADVTAVSGGGASADFILEARIKAAGSFAEIGRISGVTATGVYSAASNRYDDALGKEVRGRWEISGVTPSFTFDLLLGRME